MVCVGGSDGDTATDCLTDPSLWVSAPLAVGGGTDSPTADATLLVDLSELTARPRAVRYGWSLANGADSCCPFQAVVDGHQPCVPGSCPILSETHALPANPFFASIDPGHGKCKCIAPQTCDG